MPCSTGIPVVGPVYRNGTAPLYRAERPPRQKGQNMRCKGLRATERAARKGALVIFSSFEESRIQTQDTKETKHEEKRKEKNKRDERTEEPDILQSFSLIM